MKNQLPKTLQKIALMLLSLILSGNIMAQQNSIKNDTSKDRNESSIIVLKNNSSSKKTFFNTPKLNPNLSSEKQKGLATTASQDFTLSTNSNSITLCSSAEESVTISIIGTGGFDQIVSLSLSGLPTGATSSFSPSFISTSQTSTLTINTSIANAGSYNLIVKGVYGTIEREVPIELIINNPTLTSPLTDAIYCVGNTVETIDFTSNPIGASFSWTSTSENIGLTASGTGDILDFTAENATNNTIIATISVTPTFLGCAGVASDYTITVNPIATVTVPANTSYCHDDAIPVSTFSSTPVDVTFTWDNSNTAIGLGSSGTGDIPAFSALNTSVSPISTTITVTPTLNSCVGNPAQYTITVNPIPTVTVPANAFYCHGDAIPLSTFSSNLVDATFTWNNSNTAIGLGSSGTGNILDFTAANFTNNTIIATISVTPNLLGCLGITTDYTITVKPIPTATVPANASYCHDAAIPVSTFSSNPIGATFAWNNSNTVIGLAASGTGGIPAFTALNPSVSPISSTITVTPTLEACVGTPAQYTITVKPTPTVTVTANTSYCHGDAIPESTFSSTPVDATLTWDNSNTAIGLGSSGTGDIPAFTALNPSASPISTTITVTPTLNECVGNSVQYTITINPIPPTPIVSVENNCGNSVLTTSGTALVWSTGESTPSITVNDAATYTVTQTEGGCLSLAGSVTTAPKAIPAAPTALSVTICTGNLITLTATAPGGTYDWYDADIGGNSLSTGATYTTTTLTENTSYWVESTINECTGSRTQVTVTIAPILVANAGEDVAICNGQPHTLGATPNGTGYSYSWEESTSIEVYDILNPTVSPTETTTYTVTVTDPSGCSGTAQVLVTVKPTPTVTVPANASYCHDVAIPESTFSSTPVDATFTWDNSNTAIGLGSSGTGGIPAFTALNPSTAPISTTITVTPTLNECVGNSVQYTITVNPPTPPVFNQLGTYCVGDTPEALPLISNNNVNGTWTPDISTATAGTITYTFTPTSHQCASIETIAIITHALPIVTTSNNLSICFNQQADLYASGASSYVWDNNLGNGELQSVSPNVTTTYVVTGTDANNCSSTASTIINVDPLKCFNIPNVFSPNGDGKNDTWVLRGLEVYTDVSIQIFNRSGNKIFSTSNPKDFWNGKYHGKTVPAATYYYIIDLGNSTKNVNGTVNIIR